MTALPKISTARTAPLSDRLRAELELANCSKLQRNSTIARQKAAAFCAAGLSTIRREKKENKNTNARSSLTIHDSQALREHLRKASYLLHHVLGFGVHLVCGPLAGAAPRAGGANLLDFGQGLQPTHLNGTRRRSSRSGPLLPGRLFLVGGTGITH